MAAHSRILAWKIPWTQEPGRLQSMWSQRVRHHWVTSLFTFEAWSRESDLAQNQTHHLQADPSLSCSSSGSRDGQEHEGIGFLHWLQADTSPQVCKDLEKALSPSTLWTLFPFYYEICQLKAGTCHGHLLAASKDRSTCSGSCGLPAAPGRSSGQSRKEAQRQGGSGGQQDRSAES